MKRQIVIMASILIYTLTGCSQQFVEIPANTTVVNSEKNGEVISSNSDYGITREMLDVPSRNTKIYYPKLKGYKGELSMDYMNQSIKKLAEFYANSEDYAQVKLDYEVKRLDENIVSILFKGTGKYKGLSAFNIQKSVNLDVKTTNPIEYANFIKNDEKVRQLLDKKAKDAGLVWGLEAEGIFIYFEGNDVVFYYMPLDDSAKDWVELSIPKKELDGLINTGFGEHPAS